MLNKQFIEKLTASVELYINFEVFFFCLVLSTIITLCHIAFLQKFCPTAQKAKKYRFSGMETARFYFLFGQTTVTSVLPPLQPGSLAMRAYAQVAKMSAGDESIIIKK